MSRCMIIGWFVCIYATACIHWRLMYNFSCGPIATSVLSSSSQIASSMLYSSMNSLIRWTADGSIAMARNWTIYGCRRCELIPTSDTIIPNICPFLRNVRMQIKTAGCLKHYVTRLHMHWVSHYQCCCTVNKLRNKNAYFNTPQFCGWVSCPILARNFKSHEMDINIRCWHRKHNWQTHMFLIIFY